jgi:hypothetical protein
VDQAVLLCAAFTIGDASLARPPSAKVHQGKISLDVIAILVRIKKNN